MYIAFKVQLFCSHSRVVARVRGFHFSSSEENIIQLFLQKPNGEVYFRKQYNGERMTSGEDYRVVVSSAQGVSQRAGDKLRRRSCAKSEVRKKSSDKKSTRQV